MTARVLDGQALARRLNAALVGRASALARRPGLAVVLVGSDPASQIYVRRKGEVAARLGFHHEQHDLPATASQAEIEALVDRLDADPRIDGILVQLPLPPHVDALAVIDRISVQKDVDGLSATSLGRLAQARPLAVPCTPFGVMHLLSEAGATLSGAEACVIGRSNIVGRPMAMLLEQANATVTLCHSRTADLVAATRRADVLIAAVGRARLVRGDWIKPGAVVVDVGMNRLPDGSLCGDVDFESCAERASAITPVPRGVGPMTIAMLMENTYRASVRAQAAG